MMRRICRTIFLAVGLLSLAGVDARASRDLVKVVVDSTFFSRKLQRIAILDVMTPAVEDERVEKIEQLVQAALAEQGDFHLLFTDDLRIAAEHAGEKEAYETLLRVWHSRREIEPPALAKLGPATSIDAIVAAEVTHFEQFKLDYTQEGYSTTTIGLKIQMFDARDKTLLWQASEVYVAKSPPYNPAGFVTPDAGGVSRQGMKGVPPPPEYDRVSEKVVKDVVGTFPHEKEKGKSDKKKSKDRN